MLWRVYYEGKYYSKTISTKDSRNTLHDIVFEDGNSMEMYICSGTNFLFKANTKLQANIELFIEK